MYYFGGWCNHNHCNHNSLHELDIDHFKWILHMESSDTGPTKKDRCGMVAIHQALLVVGGIGSLPQNLQPLAQYDDGEGLLPGFARTNEHHLHNLGTGELGTEMICAVCLHVCVLAGCLCVDGGWLKDGE